MQRPQSILNIAALSIVMGLVAGIGGFLMARYFFPVTASDYISLIDSGKSISIDLEQPLTSIALSNQDSVAGVYKKVTSLTGVGQPLFSRADFLGSAVVVTSDGWLMTTDQVTINDQAVVVLGDEVHEIKEVVADQFTKTIFIRIDSSSLQPVDFQLTESLQEGERMVTNIDLPNSLDHAFFASTLTNGHFVRDQYLSTEALDYYLLAATQNDSSGFNLNSAPYFNLDGDLLGISYTIAGERIILPSEYLRQAVRHLLDQTVRPSLGVWYIDMENNSGFLRKGNLVFHPRTRAVTFGSAADEAGLREGDQIVAINNDLVSENKSLTSIIQEYREGDKVVVKILRDSVETDLEVQL